MIKIKNKPYPSLAAACRDYGQDYGAVMQRISKLGWTLEEAVTTPFRSTNSREVTLPDGTTFKSIKELCKYLELNEGTVYQYMSDAHIDEDYVV